VPLVNSLESDDFLRLWQSLNITDITLYKMENLLAKVGEEYKRIVTAEADSRSGLTIFNSSMPHAAYVTKKLLENTHEEVRILSGTFLEPFYANLKDTIEEALVHRLKLFRVITLYNKSSSFAETLKNKYPNIFDFYSLGLDATKKDVREKLQEINHFSVYDENKCRIEAIHPADLIDNSIVRAEANFNNLEVGKNLKNAFDEIWLSISKKRAVGRLRSILVS